jgi:hypothetical protein
MNLTINTYSYIAGVKTALSINSGDLVVNGVPSGSTGVSYSTTVTDNASAIISILKGGYYTYNVTVDSVFTENKIIDIILVPILSIVDPDYNRPYPHFIFFQDSYSFKTYFYNGSSYAGEIQWYFNNTPYGVGNQVVVDYKLPGSYQLKVRGTTYEPLAGIRYDSVWATDTVGISGNTTPGTASDISTYLALDLNKNITEIEYRPTFYLTASDPEDLGQIDKGYAKGEIVTITPFIELTNSSSYTVKYIITNPYGIDILSTTLNYVDIPSVTISFPIDILGNYTIKGRLTDVEGNQKYDVTLNVNTINFIDISYVSCNTFKFENRSTTIPITYSISSLTEIVVPSAGLQYNSSTEIVLPGTNLYTVTVNYNDTTEYYIINNYCDLEDCLTKATLDIFCDPTCDPCDKLENELDLIRLYSLSTTYFMKLHKEYYINNIYTALTQTKLDELTNIKQTLDKLSEYCKRIGCLDKSSDCGCNKTTTSKGGCSCH